ncbi:hypothetical protein [Streptomyces justiciae]|uniref:Uncharacterized protein n=1 Tax=Streptomyces justiciae TaxID=2780140 RepID=A0ABU3LKS6_9ACTN|nr:hypothetical protein [Streptomyces justiciae]MDT7839850.1 hypothetical protein [Streptomyces justiciae]
MNLRKRVLAVALLTITGLTTLTAPALAAPMPWETSGTVTVQCAPPCYQ